MTQPVCVIGFDLDDTLWAIDPVIRRANQTLFEWLDSRYPRITCDHTPDSLHAVCLDYMRARPAERHDLTALRKAFLRHLGRQAMYAEDFSEAAFEVFYHARNAVELFPEVENVLAELARDYTLIALSNGNACIERTGLSRYFRLAVNAAEVGSGKPDPAMFHHALDLLSCAPEDMVYIGDHPEHDVLGAQRAGVWPVWVNRDGAAWPAQMARPMAEIRDLSEIFPVLAALGAGKAGRDV